MKKTLPGYYRPTEVEFKKLWENCVFVFDANVLLNLYRYSPKTSTDMINILKNISDRIWIPHQTALEFHKSRLNVIAKQVSSYGDIQAEIKTMQNKIRDTLHTNKHPFIQNSDKLLGNAEKIFNKIGTELEKRKNEYLNSLNINGNHDTILQETTSAFEGKTGKEYSNDQLSKIYKKGKKRYAQKIPPGYKDASKGGGIRKYGDLIIWYQTIDKAKEIKKPIILVTDDKKDDWWWEQEGKTVGPRPELIQEMLSKASVQLYMYSMDNFIDKAQKYLEEKVKKETIHEARELRKRNEEHSKMLADLARLSTQTSPVLAGLAGLSDLSKNIALQTSPVLAGLSDIVGNLKYLKPDQIKILSSGLADTLKNLEQNDNMEDTNDNESIEENDSEE
ncbi:hypothetical protein E3V55_07825 [Candidatus Marinimicrobia bacterium MT.SAG.3]|nr:hypothetical protein E3V55_07825 [Candidatus Marinimicrobia bacterium MT.SAG.3]